MARVCTWTAYLQPARRPGKTTTQPTNKHHHHRRLFFTSFYFNTFDLIGNNQSIDHRHHQNKVSHFGTLMHYNNHYDYNNASNDYNNDNLWYNDDAAGRERLRLSRG